jgi:hypothetical protein
MTDVEMGQLLVSDLFAELAFDDNEKMASRLAQHVVEIDVNRRR